MFIIFFNGNIKMTNYIILLFLCFAFESEAQIVNFSCENSPDGTIWCDDFENNTPMNQKYFEYGNNGGDFIVMDGIGTDGSRGVRVVWQKGEVGAGGFKKSFGRTPSSYIGKFAANPDSNYNEIYWRMDVKHQKGWTGGGPAKLSRALVMANENWATGMMAHLWSGKNNLVMDPASGVSADGQLVSTKYNDFDNLRWLGNKGGNIDLFSTENSGQWFCVVGHAKLNDPGEANGIFEFWINDSFQAGSYNLNWHGDYNENPNNMMINAVFFENYWNNGSPVEQERYFDNIVISTEKIECNYEIATKVAQEEMSENTKIKFQSYPDKIIFTDSQVLKHKIEIFDIRGVLVKTIQLNSKELDLSDLNLGTYILRINNQSIVIRRY